MEVKPWKLMTAAEILKIKREKCQYCLYATRYGTDDRNLSVMTCDYIGITGHRRGCRPDRCDKFQEDPKTKRRKGRALRVRFKGSGEVYAHDGTGTSADTQKQHGDGRTEK